MSSHHIVRDQQEPALLIDQLDHFPVEVLHALLEWSPTVVCCESSINIYSKYGHKLDVALVGLNEIEKWERELSAQLPVSILGTEDSTFLDKGLSHLKKSGHKAVNIITDDFSLFEIIRPAMDWVSDFDIVLYTGSRRHIIQKSLAYEKWLPPYSEITVVPLLDGSCFSTKGLDHNMEEEYLQEGIELKKSLEGDISIICNKVPFLISEVLG